MYGEVKYDQDGFVVSKHSVENGRVLESETQIISYTADAVSFESLLPNYIEEKSEERQYTKEIPSISSPSGDFIVTYSLYRELNYTKNKLFNDIFPDFYKRVCEKFDGYTRGDVPPTSAPSPRR